MIEREVNIFDSKINLHPVEVENINAVIKLPFDKVEITSHCEEVRDNNSLRFVRKRKIRRVKSAGIF